MSTIEDIKKYANLIGQKVAYAEANGLVTLAQGYREQIVQFSPLCPEAVDEFRRGQVSWRANQPKGWGIR